MLLQSAVRDPGMFACARWLQCSQADRHHIKQDPHHSQDRQRIFRCCRRGGKGAQRSMSSPKLCVCLCPRGSPRQPAFAWAKPVPRRRPGDRSNAERMIHHGAGDFAHLYNLRCVCASSSLLDRIEVRQDGGDIIGFKNEFGHIGMTDRNSLRERFRQPVNGIFAGQGAKWRRSRMWAFPGTGNGVATRASGAQQLFSAPFQLCLFGHCELRNNRAGNRDNGQVDNGMHGLGTSLIEVTPSELFRKRGFSASRQRAPETIIAAGKALIHIFANPRRGRAKLTRSTRQEYNISSALQLRAQGVKHSLRRGNSHRANTASDSRS